MNDFRLQTLKACLRDVIGMSLLTLAAGASAAPCAVAARELLGAWRSRGGPFEQMELTVQGGHQVFNSWLHDRPEVSDGRWMLSGCTLQISAGRSGEGTWALEVMSLSASRLALREQGERRAAIYRRVP